MISMAVLIINGTFDYITAALSSMVLLTIGMVALIINGTFDYTTAALNINDYRDPGNGENCHLSVIICAQTIPFACFAFSGTSFSEEDNKDFNMIRPSA